MICLYEIFGVDKFRGRIEESKETGGERNEGIS